MAVIIAGAKRNKYIAIFEEQDVDFFIRINNANKERDFGYCLTVNNEDYDFVVDSKQAADLKTLESKGRHFHFLREKSAAGKQLLREMASTYSISPKCAVDMMSVLKFDVNYSIEKLRIYVEVQNKRLAFLCYSNERIEDLQRKIAERIGFQYWMIWFSFEGHSFGNVATAERTLKEINVKQGSILHCSQPSVGEQPFPPFLAGGGGRLAPRKPLKRPEKKPKRDLPQKKSAAALGEKGLVGFGRKTYQQFQKCDFQKDAAIKIEPFVIELRLKKQ